ncbi:hypothetical protein [Variovorax paradoxus]|uniref:hypothetical protein n=1 Tax=Variovorax paradoxus TaxID=34073 RepID=UPI00247AE0B6
MTSTTAESSREPVPRLPVGPIHILDVPEVWVLLWSQSQNALHIEKVGDMQRTNIDAFAENRRMDYVMLAMGNRDAVDAAADTVRPVVHARSEVARQEDLH